MEHEFEQKNDSFDEVTAQEEPSAPKNYQPPVWNASSAQNPQQPVWTPQPQQPVWNAQQPVWNPQPTPLQQPVWQNPQPVGSEPPRFNPTYGNEGNNAQTAKKTKKAKEKKGVSFLTVLLFSLGAALLGGLIGAGVIAIADKNVDLSHFADSSTSNVFEGNREHTEIEIHEIETGKVLTAAEVYAANVGSTVGITTQVTTNLWGYQTTSAASGSGFVYTDTGYILTNYHVIEDATSVSVSTYDGRSLDAEVIGYDSSNDIAVLKVKETDLKPVVIGNSSYINVGDPVVAIGNPLGELTFSLTAGAVSALDREVTFSDGATMNLIQTDCAINSGNSGGALFNMYGEVIGITNAKYSGSSGSGATIDNIGFAIPINRVRDIVDSIIENGYVVKPYIGVTIADVSAETQSYGLPQGASVRSVEADSPAEEAGLQVNDIVTHVNGQEVTGASDFKLTVTDSDPGDVLKLTVWRKGTTVELELTVGQQIQSGVQENEQSQEQNQGQGMIPDFPFFGWK